MQYVLIVRDFGTIRGREGRGRGRERKGREGRGGGREEEGAGKCSSYSLLSLLTSIAWKSSST